MTAPTLTRTLETIAVDLVDLPDLDARLDRDPEKIEDLARDILTRGLIEPIKVYRNGERYQSVDGTTRLLAHKSAGLTMIEAFVYPSKLAGVESIKFRANHFRLEMSAADEAMYFYKRYTEEFHEDIEQLAAAVGKKVPYVDARLQLVLGDDDVFYALRDRKIPIGVAQQLNKVSDGQIRRMYLHHAIEEGASVTAVTRWVNDWKIQNAAQAVPRDTSAAPMGEAPESDYHPLRCAVCGKVDPRHFPKTFTIHGHCWTVFIEPVIDAANAAPPTQ